MGSITRTPYVASRPDRRRARRQVDTALHWRRFASGLSAASPGVRGFALAGGWSLLLWFGILAVDKLV